MSTSVTSTIVAPLSEAEYQPRQGNAMKDGVHQDQNVALDKPSQTASPTPEGDSEADPNVVTWDSPDDPANPRNWSLRRKWFITILISVTTFCAYVRIFPFPTQHNMYNSWQDVLVVVTVLRCPVHRTRVSLVKRGFLPCHICIPPRVCAVADILGARFGIVREESGTHPGVDGIHPVPLGPEPRAKHGGGTRDALSMRILRMRTVEQLRWSVG